MFHWRTSVSPFLEALIHQGTVTLDFLCMDYKVKRHDDPEKTQDDNAKVRRYMQTTQTKPAVDILDTEFFDILSQAYAANLEPEMHRFGENKQFEDEPTYFVAFNKYSDQVFDKLEHWVDKRVAHVTAHPSWFPPSAVDILEGLRERLYYVLSAQTFNHYQFGLRLATPMPLMCRVLLNHLGANLESLKHWIMEVFLWMEPLVYATFREAKADHAGFDDISHMLISWMQRHGLKTAERTALNQVLSCIYSHRMLGVAQMRLVDETQPPKRASKSKLVPSKSLTKAFGKLIYPGHYHRLLDLMREWRRSEIAAKNEDPPTSEACIANRPQEASDAIEELDNGYILLHALSSTCTKWTNYPATDLTWAFATQAGYLLNVLYVFETFHCQYLKQAAVCSLREDLDLVLDIILPHYTGFWDGITAKLEGGLPEPSQTTYPISQKLALTTKASNMNLKTQEAVEKIVNLLSIPEAGAIKVGGQGTYKPTVQVFHAAQALFKVSCRSTNPFDVIH